MDKHIPVILIGQLGKYIDSNIESEVTSSTLLDRALEIINQVNERIPLNCVLVECKDVEKIGNIYIQCGFNKLQKNDYVQYFKII